MKRNGFILVVSVLLILLTSSVTFAQEVDSWNGLKEALTIGSDIKVTNSITVSEVLNIVGKTNIVNLNGKTLSGEGNSYNSGLMFSGGSLTLTNGGSITNLYYPDSTPSSVTGNEFGAIHISSGSILTITGGDLTFSGNTGGLGALNATNGSISVDVNRIVFDGNKSSTQGGGLRHDVSATAYNNTAARITANEIVFSNNEIDNTTTVGSGAGAMNSRGNMELLGDTVTFINNSMNATVAEGRKYKVGGGAVANQSGENAGSIFNATMVIGKDENSTVIFSGNTSSTYGGAIMNRAVDDDGNATLTINGTSTFSNNSASLGGGAIYNIAQNGHIAQINLNGASTFTGNTSTGQGGAIYNTGNATISDAVFTGNSASADGGAIYNEGSLTISNTMFSNNCADGWSGGIETYGDLVISGGSFTNNSSGEYAGAFGIYGATAMIDGTEFKSNTAEDGAGAVYANKTSELTIKNAIFIDNEATASDASGGAIASSAALTITNTTFDRNISHDGGGAIYNYVTAGYVNIKDSVVKNNVSTSGGGMFLLSRTSVSNIDNVEFKGNKAIEDVAADGDGGGAIMIGSEARVKITNNSNFEANTSATRGGAIATRTTEQSNGALGLSIDAATFTTNSAVTDGGAIYVNAWHDADGHDGVKISGSTFTENSAANGGAIYNDAVTGKIGNIIITDSTFTNNTATGQGGAIYNAGTITINGAATFSGNKMNVVYTGDEITSYTPNDIYNTGTLNLNAGEDKTIVLSGGIDGESGIVNMSGAGLVEVTADIKNQTVVVNSGELHLLSTDVDGSNLSGSTVAVKSGAVINTIDGVINDYSSKITLENGANVKVDTSLSGTPSVDKFIIASGDSVIVNEIKVLTDTDTSVTVNIADSGNVSFAENSVVYTTANKYTVAGNTSDNGQITLTKAGTGGLKTVADQTVVDGDARDNVTYTLTGIDSTTSSDAAIIKKADIKIIGAGNSNTQKVVLSNDLTVGADENDNSTLTLNEVKFEEGAATAGKIVNNEASRLTIKDSVIGVTIQNKGTLISDPSTYTVHQINEGTASYTDDTFALAAPYTGAADTTAQGGALYNTGTLTLTNTDFTNNILRSAIKSEDAAVTKNSAATGGAIWTNKAVNITGGTFSENKAYGRSWNGTTSGSTGSVGGAIAFSGGADVTTDSTIDGVTFAGNKVTYDFISSGTSTEKTTGYGGAIYYNQTANLNILGDSSFTDNEAAYGGAIYGYAGSVIIGGDGNNVTISNNTAATQGGGIFNNNANLSVTDAIIASNTSGIGGGIYTKGGSITGADINSNSSTATTSTGGGGIYNITGNLTVTDSTIGGAGKGNTAKNSGGGIYSIGNGTVTVDSSSITYNTAKLGSTTDVNNAGGGGIYKTGSGTLTIQNSSHIDNNTATKSFGGGIYNPGSGAITISESTVSNNTANYGGGIYKNSTGTLTLTDATVNSNTASNSGGGIYNAGAGNILLTDSTMSGNTAGNIGGGIYNAGAGNISLTDTTMNGNTAGIAGAIASMSTGKLNITHSTFTANTATDTDNGRGGVIYAQNAGNVTILGSAFGDGTVANANVAATNGGAINVSNTKLTIDKDTSDNNTTFNYNTAKSGGAIYASNSATLDIANTDFSNNKAAGTVGDSGDGGAIYITYTVTGADIDNATFTSNTAVRGGGAVWAGVDTNITNSTFTSNSTTGTGDTNDYGAGALFVGGSSNTTVINSKFVTNTSAGNGGAIATRNSASGSSLNITVVGTAATEFNSNSAVNGGAIYIGIETTIANTNFTNNIATSNGGAIYNTSTLTLNDTEFYSNTSTDRGGAIYNEGDITIKGGTSFTSNTAANGGAIYNDGADNANNVGNILITDTNFTGNIATSNGGAIYNNGVVTINAQSADVTFSGNKSNYVDAEHYTSNAIYNAGTLSLNSLNSNYKIYMNDGIVSTNDSTMNINSYTGAVGEVVFNANVQTNNLNVAAGTLTNNSDKTLTVGGNISVTSGATFDNEGTLVLTGDKTISGAISGDGSLSLQSGQRINNGTISQESITISGGSLTTNAGYLTITNGIVNNVTGGLILTGGENDNIITGTGSTVIDGTVVNSSIITNAITINSGKSLATSAAVRDDYGNLVLGISNTVSNAGTLNLTGGIIEQAISGGGIAHIKGNVINNATAINQSQFIIDSGSLTTNASRIHGLITNNADDGLVLVGGDNAYTIQGSGSTVIDGIVSSNTPISSAGIKIVAETTADPAKKGQLTMGAGNIGGNVINDGSLVLTGGTLEKAVSGSGTTIIDGENVVNSSTITNAITINSGKSLTTSAAVKDADEKLILGISNTVSNAGTLNLKGGTVENAISGSGLTIIDGIVSSNASISNSEGIQINAQITSSDLPAVAQLTIAADKVGTVVTNNGRLVLTGGTLEKAVSGNGGTLATNDGVSIASTASVTQGTVNISGTLTNEGTLIVKSALDSTSGAKLINKGNLYLNMGTASALATLSTVISDNSTGTGTGKTFVNGKINNLNLITQKMITINSNGILKTNANAIQTISGIVNNEANGLIFTGGNNGNTITGTGTTQILAGTDTVTNNAVISQGVNVKSGTLRTNASTIATDAGATIKNDGTITLTDGILSKAINPLTTAGNGTVEIAAGANNSVLANAQITGNKIKLTSGVYDVTKLANTAGDIDLTSATSLVGNGGRLSVVDNKTGTINLGKVDATVSNINIGINVNYETGDADVLSLTSFVDTTKKIMIDEINVLANPIETEFSANVADESARDYVDLSATTFSGTGIGSFLISYDKSTGDLKGVHSDLTNAVTSTLTSKVYNMSADETITPLTLSDTTDTAQSLSVTANGHIISAATTGDNGITLGGGDNNQSLTINNAVISGFGTAIANGEKGTLTLNGVTVSAATTAAANTISNTNVLNLKGENNLNSTISGSGDLIVIDGATLNTGVISQKTITIDDGAVFTTSAAVRDDLDLIAGYETTSALLTNNGRLNITGGTVEKTISGGGVTHIQGSVTSDALISTVMTIDDANSLAISADNVGNTVSNEGGTLTLSDGTIVYAVSGSGSTVIDGTVVNGSTITNDITINSGKSLTTSAAVRDDDGNLVLGISNTVNNAGTLNLTGGIIEQAISGGGGIEITGNVLNAAEVSQNNITISGGSLTTNAGLITANTNIINNVDNGLIFTGGTNKNNVAGNGTVKVDTAVQVDNTAVISNGVNLVSGTLQNTGEIKGNVAVTTGTLRTNASTIATDAGATIKNDGTITLTGGTLSKTINPLTTAGSGTVEIAAGANNSVLANAQITGNKIKLTSGALNLSGLADATTGDIDLSAVTSVTSNGGAISTTNGKFENTNLGNLVLNSDLTYFVDMDILSQKIDTIEINSLDTADKNLKIQVITPTQIRKPITQTVFKMSPISDKITDATLRAKLSQSVNVNGLNNIISPIYKYKPNYDANTGMVTYGLAGHGKGDWKSYNPSILATPIAALTGGYLTQLSTYEEAFTNMDMYMLMTSEQRTALKHANKIADAQVANEAVPYDLYASSNNTNDLWFRPYASYENVHLRRGPKVHNAMYGTFFGGDSKLIELSKGWDVMFSGYVGYTGSHQSYNGVGMYQNGGAIGATAMLFKNNFFAGLTANVGASVADVSTMYGSDDITLLMAGAALRTGYNFEFLRGKFIIQPSMTVSYSFVNTFDYKASSGARLKADPLHAINIQPGFKLIGNFKHGWQPYAGVYFVWNFLDKTKVTAQDVSLPEMSVKPYLRYGFGIQKKVGDRFTGFAQMYLHSIGRSGVSFALGFKWALGKKEPPAPMAQPVFVK